MKPAGRTRAIAVSLLAALKLTAGAVTERSAGSAAAAAPSTVRAAAADVDWARKLLNSQVATPAIEDSNVPA